MMHDMLGATVLDNAVRSWLLALAVGVGGFLLLLLARRLLAGRVRALKDRRDRVWTGMLARLVPRTRAYFLFMIALDAASVFLTLSAGIPADWPWSPGSCSRCSRALGERPDR